LNLGRNIKNLPEVRCRILVAPLNWGLGHATRCVPIIQCLISNGAQVIIAAEGKCAQLLKEEFPELKIVHLRGYRVRYSSDPKRFNLKLLLQLPRALITFIREKAFIKKIVRKENIDAIVSDNRPGLFHSDIPAFYITHQLHIETGNKKWGSYAEKIHQFLISSFKECWVPDEEGDNNLGGKLSHPKIFPVVPVSYIGCISRFQKKETVQQYDLLIMLSGPEPLRTMLENKLLHQAAHTSLSIAFVRGLPGITKKIKVGANISIFNHLPSNELNELIESSGIVLARCGYSTIMDLALLQKKAILIPTPGQKEQEYLATYLKEKKYFYTVEQKNMDISKDISELNKTTYLLPKLKGLNEEKIIERLKHYGLISK